MNIVVFGSPGSGKGTQAEFIARKYGHAYISTGDIFRYNLKNETALGKKAAKYLQQGLLVPDRITNKLVKDRLQNPDCEKGLVLDGYPRTRSQQKFLDKLIKIDAVIVIELSNQQAISRLAARLACKCGLSYHLQHNPPKKPGVCNQCGGRLFRREDDQPEAVEKRFEIYQNETKKILPEYEKRGILYRVDGSGTIEEVLNNISRIFDKIKSI